MKRNTLRLFTFAVLAVSVVAVVVVLFQLDQVRAQSFRMQPGDPENLPWCDESLFKEPINPANLSPPDPKAETVCRLRVKITPFNTTEDLRKQGASIPRSSLVYMQQKKPEDVGERGASIPSSSLMNLLSASYAHAVHELSCFNSAAGCSTSSPGITYVYYNVSTQEPSLTNNSTGNWWNYHFYNRAHLIHPSYFGCYGYQSLSAGFAHGSLGAQIRFKRIVGEVLVAQGVCQVYDTGGVCVAFLETVACITTFMSFWAQRHECRGTFSV